MSLTVSHLAGKRVRFLLGGGVFAVLVTVGVFASNDWFPRTDGLTGQKYGWFGKKLPKNTTASAWNPIQPPPPTPQLSKEYIYAGSRMLAVEDANATSAPPADIAVWRPSGGEWYVMGQTGSTQTTFAWGISTDIPVPGDFDGDGKTDFSIFRPSTGVWWIYYSSTSTYDSISWGDVSGDKPIAADFDGDGLSDPTIVRWYSAESVYKWFVLKSTGGGFDMIDWGANGDVPAAADFDGDGKADVGMFRPSTDVFYWKGSSNGQDQSVALNDGDVPVPSDYDGDGKADPAVFKPSTAYWYIHQSTTNSLVSLQWGTSGDKPVQNDYDGDGKTDLAVWDNSMLGNWTIKRSSNNTTRTEAWGITNDIPVPAFYRR